MKAGWSHGFRVLGILAMAAAAGGCGKKETASSTQASNPAAPSPAPEIADPGMVLDRMVLGDQTIEVNHSKFDMGHPEQLFDGDANTFARTQKANPAILEFTFPKARPVKGLEVTVGSMELGLVARVTTAAGDEKVFSKQYSGAGVPPNPKVQLDFGSSVPTSKIHLEVKNLEGGDGHIHIREITFK